jgi:2-oxoglutarate dehydrogenase complex dehydrogenase (E1) component-like enzyme
VGRVVFCTGQVFSDLTAAREEQNVRIEQLYPFAEMLVKDILLRYPITAEVVWAREEPRNMGAWRFVAEPFRPLLDPTRRELRYVGHPESASPATGSLKRHQEEEAEIAREALTLGAVSKARKVRVITRRKVK